MKKVKLKAVRTRLTLGPNPTEEQLLKQIVDLEEQIERIEETGDYSILGYQALAGLKKRYLEIVRRKQKELSSVKTAVSINSLTGRPQKRHRYKSCDTKPSYLGYALYHHYWYRNTGNPAVRITEFTCEKIAIGHGISSRQLWKYAAPMLDKKYEPPKHYNTKREYAKQYRLILPLLKEVCPAAHDEVELKLRQLINANSRLNL